MKQRYKAPYECHVTRGHLEVAFTKLSRQHYLYGSSAAKTDELKLTTFKAEERFL
jgi:hypothetical protein